MFRRRTEAAPTAVPEDTLPSGQSAGKGRPTPKRKEAEKRNRQPITAPKDRKDAYRRERERGADRRTKIREGIARGDDKYLPKRDKGPVRKLARDYVDSRRTLASYVMYMLIIIVLIGFIRNPFTQVLYPFAMAAMILIVLVEGFLIARGVKKLAAQRFPSESRAGVGMYAAMRSMQMRRLRMPNPTLKPGDQDKV